MPNISYKTCYYLFILWFDKILHLGGFFGPRTNTHRNCRVFQTCLKLCTTAVLCNIFVWCLRFLLRSGIVAFARFTAWILNLQLLKMVCFAEVNTGSEKLQNLFPAFIDKMVMFIYCLVDVRKHFIYWLSSSKSLLNYLTCFPRDSRVTLKQGRMLNFRLQFEFQLLTNSLNVSLFTAENYFVRVIYFKTIPFILL